MIKKRFVTKIISCRKNNNKRKSKQDDFQPFKYRGNEREKYGEREDDCTDKLVMTNVVAWLSLGPSSLGEPSLQPLLSNCTF